MTRLFWKRGAPRCHGQPYPELSTRFAEWKKFHGLTYADCAAMCGLSEYTLVVFKTQPGAHMMQSTIDIIVHMMEELP